VVLLFQLFKPHIHDEIAGFVPLIMDTINLNAMESVRNPDKINVEMHVDFVGVQVKTISFLAYIIRVFQDVSNLSSVFINQKPAF
jgi:transformation/transcription domain-associated protein